MNENIKESSGSFKKFLFRLGFYQLRWKFYIPLLIVTSISVSYLYFVWLPSSIDFFVNESAQNIAQNLHTLGEGIATPILESQLSSIYDTLDAVKVKNPNWLELQLFDEKKRSLYPLEIDPIRMRNGLRQIAVAIDIENVRIGYLQLLYDFGPLEASIRSRSLEALVGFLVVVVILAVLFAIIIQRRMVNPIKDLTKASSDLAAGNFNISLPDLSDEKSEVGELAQSFILMKEEILDSQTLLKKKNLDLLKTKGDLQKLNESLEDLVEIRTKELKMVTAQSLQSSKLAALGEMAGGIAHEINSPLLSIKSSVNLIEKAKKKNKMSESLLDNSLNLIGNTVDRIAHIVTGLRNISRDSTGNPHEKVSVKDLVQDVFALCSEKMKNYRVTLHYQAEHQEKGGEAWVCCDRIQISQVLLNLINNSFDAVKGKSEKWIRISSMRLDEKILFKVFDSGDGISSEKREKIFDPFYTSKEIGAGTGLGLSISKKIVENHGGSLEFDFNEKVTCFKFSLPSVDPIKAVDAVFKSQTSHQRRGEEKREVQL